ncbi:unnamed protein product [Cercospora beticola]|nr:unnamed protein product [Cercospora beticola]
MVPVERARNALGPSISSCRSAISCRMPTDSHAGGLGWLPVLAKNCLQKHHRPSNSNGDTRNKSEAKSVACEATGTSFWAPPRRPQALCPSHNETASPKDQDELLSTAEAPHTFLPKPSPTQPHQTSNPSGARPSSIKSALPMAFKYRTQSEASHLAAKGNRTKEENCLGSKEQEQ